MRQRKISPKDNNLHLFEYAASESSQGNNAFFDYLSHVRELLGTPIDVSLSHPIGDKPFWGKIRILTVSSDFSLAQVHASDHVLKGVDHKSTSNAYYEFHLGKCVKEANSGRPLEGGLVLVDTGKAFRWQAEKNFELFIIRISRRHLKTLLGNITPFVGKVIPMSIPYINMLFNFSCDAYPIMFRSTDSMAVFGITKALTDLIIGAYNTFEPENLDQKTGRAVLLRYAMEYIDANLLDPDLTPHSISEALHISNSYLYSLFQDNSLSISREIWNRRLTKAHHALSDPKYAARSVSDIAFTFCFNSLAHFSRVHKSVYQQSPKQYRALLKQREKIRKEESAKTR